MGSAANSWPPTQFFDSHGKAPSLFEGTGQLTDAANNLGNESGWQIPHSVAQEL
jgi:hypothetical protein